MRIAARVALVCTVVLLVLSGSAGGGRSPVDEPASAQPEPPPAQDRLGGADLRPADRPDIVLVLMDDVSVELVRTMRQAAEMAREGASYEHSYVVDSLCCVSRASLLTGQYPHQTGVRTNTANTPNLVGPLGGFEAFATYGNEERSVNVRLQDAGYTTGYIGKFLNQYDGWPDEVPPGWSDWQAVHASAYDGWGFDITESTDGGEAFSTYVPTPPEWTSPEEKDAAYVGTVIADRALAFIREHRDDEAPYFLTVAPYAAHSRVGPEGAYPDEPVFPPAFRDRASEGRPGNCGTVPCSALGLADLPGYADDQSDNAPRWADGRRAPQWRPAETVLTPRGAVATLRRRAQMVQSIDRMLRDIRRAVGRDTYVVLTSDNGFHIGQHRLERGKGTPFTSDVRVPLLVTGPGVGAGVRREVVSNLDLAPTVEELAGLRPARFRSGVSLVPTLRDRDLERRRFTFFEHTWARSLGTDPDAFYAGGTMDLIPSYVAVRSRDALLVRFDLDPSWDGVEHAYELYDYGAVGWERTNAYADPRRRATLALLTRKLAAFDRCATVTGDTPVPPRCRRLTR
ncbi:sulfatase-like hydrolase/transferase [Nocardioides coralli]|uniref:sulfatase-like hydrolase/transferase n=1 Tax=Nocardioides coralli TaxID=2872154 RepID=UPI001CA3A97E|nr:sulfatase-like hydrolase/transferase [Nocardioides coralli]QZY28998.1 sulfatase-like hydrolase/transferase [Nocardioides coralli]